MVEITRRSAIVQALTAMVGAASVPAIAAGAESVIDPHPGWERRRDESERLMNEAQAHAEAIEETLPHIEVPWAGVWLHTYNDAREVTSSEFYKADQLLRLMQRTKAEESHPEFWRGFFYRNDPHQAVRRWRVRTARTHARYLAEIRRTMPAQKAAQAEIERLRAESGLVAALAESERQCDIVVEMESLIATTPADTVAGLAVQVRLLEQWVDVHDLGKGAAKTLVDNITSFAERHGGAA